MPRKSATPAELLAEYRRKRDFTRTAEPAGGGAADRARHSDLRFVIQKHRASHLHFDFRLEMAGVMKSWAVPKGPSLDTSVKRLAVEVEDHPISYNTFEGTIPAGEYGGGTVMLWDRGTYAPTDHEGEGEEKALLRAHESGRLDITLHGERLRGAWSLFRTRSGGDDGGKPQWLLVKRTDDYANPGFEMVEVEETSVDTGRTMDEIAEGKRGGSKVWHSNRAPKDGAVRASVAAAAAKAGTRRKRSAEAEAPVSTSTETARPSGDAGAALEPMYASIGTAVPRGEGWTFEPKYDGIRVLAFVTPHEVRLVTRNGKDKTRQFPEVATDLQRLAAKAKRPLVLDGEVVALEGGEPARFQKLQSRMHVTGAADIARHAGKTPSALIVFDMLLDGGDVLLQEPWTVRRARLEKRLGKHVSEILRLGGTEQGDGEALLRKARETGWEGVIAKRTDSTYTPGARSPSWLKLKVEFRQELVVGGYTEPRNTRQHMGALIVGYYRGGELVYAGNVGGGFNARSLKAMWDRLAPLERKTSPFADPPKTAEPAHWVEPKIVVEVKFAEWTEDGKLRQPIYLGTRDDKPASEVTREDTSVQADEKPKRQRASSAVAQSAPADGGDGDSKPKKSARRASAGKAGASESAVRRASPESAKETGDAKRSASTDRRSSSGAETKPRKKAGASNDDESKKKASAAREAGAKKKPMGKQSDDAVRVKGAPVKVIAELRRIEEAGGSGRLELGRGVSLDVTHLGKTFFPEPGFTKGDLLRYYAQVSPLLLPAIRDRPLVLKRFPNGAAGEGFFQHKAGDVPPGVRVERVYPERGTEADRIVGGDLATLLYVAQIGSISVDPWHSRVQSPELADYTVIDLDPGDDAPFSTVVQVARWVKEEMDALGLHGALKTSGATGLHVFLPLPPNTPSEAGRLLAQLVATRVAVAHPREATVERAVRARATDSVYVDFMQNEVGKTVAGVYAVRARPEATVSTPLRWDELDDALDPRNFTLATVPARLAEAGDLWAPAMKRKNSLTSVLKRAGAG